MAKVSGPLGSFSASGSIAGMLTFATTKGRQYVRQLVVPANPNSAAQKSVRANFGGLVALYHANLNTITTNFTAKAAQGVTSILAAFVGFNQKQWSQAHGASINASPTYAVASAANTAPLATVSGNAITYSWVDSVDANAWCTYVYRALGAAPTGLKNELIAVVKRGDLAYVDSGLAPGTWHYKGKACSQQGGFAALTADVNGVVA